MTHVHPTHDDVVVASLSEVVGGPVGEHAGPPQGRSTGRRWGVSVLGVLLALTALTFALGLVSKTACAVQGWPTDGTTPFTHACGSDLADTWTGLGLADPTWPWGTEAAARGQVTDRPALVGLWSWAAAGVANAVTSSDESGQRAFVAVNALGLAGLALLATLALARAHRRRPWDAAAFAAAPALALFGIVSWDLLPVAAAAGALWAWSRGRLVLAGALVGVGAAAGVWPALLLAAYAVGCVRDRRPARVLPPVVTALAVWAVLNAPAFLSGRDAWERSWSVAWGRGPDQGSVWTVVDLTAGISGDVARTAAWIVVGLWWAGVVALALLAPVRPRLSQVAFLLVAGVLVLGVAYEPQQALWLLPLAALARPRWRDLLVWQAAEAVHFAMYWWWRGGLLAPGAGEPGRWYVLAIAVHLAGTLWLVALVVRDVWWPGRDPVRETEWDLGGANPDEPRGAREPVLV